MTDARSNNPFNYRNFGPARPSRLDEFYDSVNRVKGHIIDVAHYVKDGKVVKSEVLQDTHNIIVADIAKVIAGTLAGRRFTITNQSLTVSSVNTWLDIGMARLVDESVVVKNNSGTTTYVLGEDYDLNCFNGQIRIKSGGSIGLGNTIRLTYDHTENLFWAVGSGDPDWDNDLDPSIHEDVLTTQLVNETYRKRIPYSSFSFINTNNQVVPGPTDRIQIVLNFLEGEANGELREFAIVGYDANTTLNSGILIDHKIHKVITKTPEIRLERTIRFKF